MLAFSLLELGRMEDAEKAAKKGFDINKKDCWAQHAVSDINKVTYSSGILLLFHWP